MKKDCRRKPAGGLISRNIIKKTGVGLLKVGSLLILLMILLQTILSSSTAVSKITL
jgi:hypothetical protein